MTLTVETWCEALESGKYAQAQDCLRRDSILGSAFCCLGVACDLSGLGRWSFDCYVVDAASRSYCDLPFPVRSHLGLATANGEFLATTLPDELQSEIREHVFIEKSGRTSLVSLNDNGVPFPLIAEVIRARPKGLFREEPSP